MTEVDDFLDKFDNFIDKNNENLSGEHSDISPLSVEYYGVSLSPEPDPINLNK